MSSIHLKLAAIAAAIHNAFNFADPLAKLQEAEDEFKQAVADEIKALTDRVVKLEGAPAALTDGTQWLSPEPISHAHTISNNSPYGHPIFVSDSASGANMGNPVAMDAPSAAAVATTSTDTAQTSSELPAVAGLEPAASPSGASGTDASQSTDPSQAAPIVPDAVTSASITTDPGIPAAPVSDVALDGAIASAAVVLDTPVPVPAVADAALDTAIAASTAPAAE
jgi:hypothetical protein